MAEVLNVAIQSSAEVQPIRPSQRWILAGCVCWVLFVNHYARDVTGALEREIENDVDISVAQYQTLNSAYFAPNLVAPFVSGLIAQWIGAPRMLVISAAVAILGHFAVALGGQLRWYGLLLTGRIVLGLTYETIDVMPLPILAPLFSDDWGLLVGLFNACLRMGSVTNFAVTPAVYSVAGLAGALWVSAAFGLSGCLAALVAHSLDRRLKKSRDAARENSAADSDRGRGSGDDTTHTLVARDRALSIFVAYATLGALTYASIVPFWFYGGAFIREKWGYSLSAADALMLFPEGGMVILSPPIGILVDSRLRSMPRRLIALPFCLALVIVGFSCLALLPAEALPPIVPLGFLGVGYAASNTIFWSASDKMVPKAYYAIGSGIVGSMLNLGATTLPIAMAHASSGAVALMLLAFAAGLAALAALALFWIWPRQSQPLLTGCQ